MIEEVDPFDLPEWVGACQVVWQAATSVGAAYLLSGELAGEQAEKLPCDLMACDPAYPRVVIDEQHRHDAHQAWTLGQVLLLRLDGRLTMVVPGTLVLTDVVLEAVRRLAKAVGAPADRFSVTLRL